MRTYTRAHVAIASAVAYSLAALSLIWIQMVIAPPPSPEPVQWMMTAPWPANPVCPGDAIHYAVAIRVNEPGGLYIYSAIRRAPDHPEILAAATQSRNIAAAMGATLAGDTVIPAQAIFRTAFTPGEIPAAIVDLDNEFIVPDLPPGRYVRVTVAGLDGRNARQATRAQVFEVGSSCAR